MRISRRTNLKFCVALLALFAPSLVLADPAPNPNLQNQVIGVVELFTSQGCSSCPPADAVFGDYARRRDIVALSLAVDYWDYLGWRDTLASRHNTNRQQIYSRGRRDGAIYTPQAVVNGVAHMNGAIRARIDNALQTTRSAFRARQIPMFLRAEGKALVIDIGAASPGAAAHDAVVWLAPVQSQAVVVIARGENADRRVTYHNVVRSLTPVGTWTGAALTIRLDRAATLGSDADDCAVLLQSGDGGPLIGAAWIAR